ncbi:MAG: AAA-like domain-containing protein [Fibromonadales bacterium]|nr:AAA-like domain-containing protein [Fibromonadales bacterium]
MRKEFNTTGPCHQSKHYMLDPFRNIGNELMELIDRENYFVIHAARQSGKTTLLWELADKINAEGKYYALYCSLEAIQDFKEPERGIPEIVKKIESYMEDQCLPKGFAKEADYSNVSNVLNRSLISYCRSLDKPLVIFFDEADCLSEGTLITFLRQLREGFVSRARVPFVHSIALVGMRNIRDYKGRIRPDKESLGSASPFNIISEAMTLKNFTKQEITQFYSQHTKLTKQAFKKDALEYIFEQTGGQPWLVNAVARECVEKICKFNYSISITKEMARTAVHNIILTRGTHLDSLMERLKEERVRKIIEPLILGDSLAVNRISDDYLYTRDLGLIKEVGNGAVEPANKIYAEIMVRYLNYTLQENFKIEMPNANLPKYIKNGKIDINRLLKEFQIFWRENSDIWVKKYKKNLYQYDEAAPHLVIQAFFQRVLNGGGEISREMALGKNRCDICIKWKDQKYPIELKLYESSKTAENSLAQIWKYMENVSSKEGWIVIFDRTPRKGWDKKLYMKEFKEVGKKVTIFGC